jgi:hypothetical protein
MTTLPDSTTAAIRAFAVREGITPDEAAARLIGYGLSAMSEHERLIESLKPRPYRIECCEARSDDDGEPTLTDYAEIGAHSTLDGARADLCTLADAGEDARAAISSAPIGHVLAIGGSYYRITKTATE